MLPPGSPLDAARARFSRTAAMTGAAEPRVGGRVPAIRRRDAWPRRYRLSPEALYARSARTPGPLRFALTVPLDASARAAKSRPPVTLAGPRHCANARPDRRPYATARSRGPHSTRRVAG